MPFLSRPDLTEVIPSFRDLAESLPAVVYTAATDDSGSTVYVNGYIRTLLGYSQEEWLADPELWLRQVHPDDRERVLAAFQGLVHDRDSISFEYRIGHKDGRTVWVRDSVRVIQVRDGSPPVYQGVMVDISREKEDAERHRRIEQAYRTLFAANPNPMWVYDLETLRFLAVNDAAVRRYGYSQAEFRAMTIKDIRPPEDVPRLMQNLAAVSEGLDEAGVWRHRRKDGAVIEVEITSHTLQYEGRAAEAVLAHDVTEQRAAHHEVQRQVQRVERLLMSTVEVVTKAVELRDPYTAGHEHRVGELAAMIAAEMGLNAETQKGLRIAGALHDVGKIAVPADLLNRPGRLSPVELDLIRTHAQAGYDVLKAVEFPWPVAEVARQHHERADGSGYPRGLAGEEILLEARIVGVADVIEAVAAHRPYRVGLGFEAALVEIERNRGRHYDPTVVDAALRICRVPGFRMPA